MWLDDRTRAAVASARVHDVMGRLRGRHVLSFVLEHVRSHDLAAQVLDPSEAQAAGFAPHAGWQFVRLGRRVAGLEVNFSNSRPLLSGAVALANGDKLFWQYQASQWRLAVTTADYQGRDDAVRARRHAYVADRYGAWFDFAPVAELLGAHRGMPVPVRGGERFQRFDPDFAYRYAKVDRDERSLTVGELAQLAVHYLSGAASWNE